jgi:hypothetical protein
MVRRFLLLAAVIGLGAAFVAPAAHAAFGIEKWESLTCTTNVDTLPPNGTVEIPIAAQPGQCRETSPDLFTQAAGHPNFGITDFTLNTYPFSSGIGGFPEGFVKDIVVNTPEGLSVNPEALPQCSVEELASATHCPNNTIVGINYLTIAAFAPNPNTGKCEKEKAPEGSGEFEALPLCPQARVAVPVYNMVPFNEVPSMVAFLTETGPTFIVGSLSPVDQHVTFTISNVHAPAAGPPKSPPIVGSRLVFFGGKEGNINPASNGTYLTMPSNCAGPQVSKLNVDSYGPPYSAASIAAEKSFATPTGASGCANVPFAPEIKVSTDGPKAVDSPEATTVDVGIPFDPTAQIANSYLQVAKVTLPEGMGINPSVANGLQTCTEAQFGYHTNNAVTCPESSRIGTVEVQTPSLPANSIGGNVYIGAPLKNGPGAAATGEQFRILIHAFSVRYGVNVRLKGTVVPNPLTGQLTATVAENPQATFRNFRLHFFGGNRGVLTSPSTCGTANTTTTLLTPWSGQANATPSSAFALTSYPGGGACPTTLAGRPFVPSYSATSDSSAAGAYSPFRVTIARTDGQQELKVVNVTLPKGLTGKLAGVPYCPEAAIAATEAGSGTAQKASPSCPAASRVGGVAVTAGTGGAPFKIEGSAYLAGPYKGAPISLVIATPAVAGPYDLGTVVDRVALNVNPETAQINAVSDPIPNVFGGVKLDIRSIVVNVDKSAFMVNPTNCSAQATAGAINGGGANPANPAAFSTYAVSAPYQATGCNKLNFKPKFNTRLYGPTKRNTYPRIRAILTARKGDANVARTALTLPHSLFLEQGHIGTICTRPQLAAQQCPSGAVYGHAEAKSPLLENKLKGPVYLVSSNHTLPDLVADLRGQVNIQLHGVISSKRGGLKTVFNSVPDVPVSKFILNMRGGKKSLLVNSTNTCASPQLAVLNIKGQNGKKAVNNKFRLNISSCAKQGKGKKHKK